MKVIEKSKENMTAKELYNLTMNPETKKLSEQAGSVIEVAMYCKFLDTKDEKQEDGSVKQKDEKIFSILTPDGEVFATNSETLMRDFDSIVELYKECGEELPAITVITGTSKKGREFITCKVAD